MDSRLVSREEVTMTERASGWGWVNLVSTVGNQEVHKIEASMAKRLVYFKLVGEIYPFFYISKVWRWMDMRIFFPLGGRGSGDFSQKEQHVRWRWSGQWFSFFQEDLSSAAN